MGKYKAIIAILVVLILAAISLLVYVIVNEKQKEANRIFEANQNTTGTNQIEENASKGDNVIPSASNEPIQAPTPSQEPTQNNNPVVPNNEPEQQPINQPEDTNTGDNEPVDQEQTPVVPDNLPEQEPVNQPEVTDIENQSNT